MKIGDIFKNKVLTTSFEVFPPNDKVGLDQVYNCLDTLTLENPDFISVTYGAGGNTKGRTVEIAERIKSQNNVEALAHFTCIGSKKEEIDRVLNELEKNNIENILALRGDYPIDRDLEPGDFNYAKDLIKYIREKKGDKFSIGAAYYVEGHRETNDLLDLFHLKEKVDTGVDFLISQIFLDNEFFYSFRDKLEKLQIDKPLVAGIMPVTNAKQIKKITSLCSCTIPKKFLKILEKYEDNPAALKEAGLAYAIEQIVDLVASDINGIHIYTMNKPETAKKIIDATGIIRK
ncbi:methylenetetrahydrofolate reductase [NAD(P)H] [Fusobacterium massiliense]|jgi:methylenetetrahydrofolate reductase (NAD(P)H)|uniref:methylenetetrahydrofolate reductase [NAD(P)H] n=1 Tax=Fusobacterium massiliense TaxID=1852365 RepID=UPI0028D0DF9A|nr:methylenetetrahydrofolate reductase [NAD(P)H] [Fusobacterium massiliense]